jgi:hypothetical protein
LPPQARGFYTPTLWPTTQPGLELAYGYYGFSSAPPTFLPFSQGAPLVDGQQWFYQTPSEHPYAQQWFLGANHPPLGVEPPLTHFPYVTTPPYFQGVSLVYGQQQYPGGFEHHLRPAYEQSKPVLPAAQSMQAVASTEGTSSELTDKKNCSQMVVPLRSNVALAVVVAQPTKE